jgi:hypothetical protein
MKAAKEIINGLSNQRTAKWAALPKDSPMGDGGQKLAKMLLKCGQAGNIGGCCMTLKTKIGWKHCESHR